MFQKSMRIYVTVAAFLAMHCWQANLHAQTRPTNRPATAARSPGFVHRGRFIGFVPAHVTARSQSGADVNAGTPPTAQHPSSNGEIQPTEFITNAENAGASADGESYMLEEFSTPDFATPASNQMEWISKADCGLPMICQPSRVWGSAEYLLWWTDALDVPALATSSPNGTPASQAGVLGQSGTRVLFGDAGLNDDSRSGGRFTFGMWFDPYRGRGLEVTYLMLDRETAPFVASEDEFPILARPFFNAQRNVQDARQIAFPTTTEGTLAIDVSTDLQAYEALFRASAVDAPGQHLDFLAGYRFIELEDQVGIRESTEALSSPIAGTTFDLVDQFDTRNEFNGGEVGIAMTCQGADAWMWEAVVKVALGNTKSRASVLGRTTTTTAQGSSATTQAGLLAQGTNIGEFEQTEFSVIPEIGITLHRQLGCGWKASVGYTFLFWSDVARAGDQIDLGVNPSQIPPGTLVGRTRPEFNFETTDFWAQGISLGLDFSF